MQVLMNNTIKNMKLFRYDCHDSRFLEYVIHKELKVLFLFV